MSVATRSFSKFFLLFKKNVVDYGVKSFAPSRLILKVCTIYCLRLNYSVNKIKDSTTVNFPLLKPCCIEDKPFFSSKKITIFWQIIHCHIFVKNSEDQNRHMIVCMLVITWFKDQNSCTNFELFMKFSGTYTNITNIFLTYHNFLD